MVILSALLLILIPLATRPNISPASNLPQPSGGESNSFTQSEPAPFAQEERSPDVLQAIEEQKQADQEYDSWQQANSDSYSWIRKLPLTADNYFIYFDLNKKVFIGRLYPKAGENIEQTKADILNTLKTQKEIPVERFRFEWLVNPT